jgi:hypothetical protein
MASLSPLDLLSLPSTQQDVIRCLVRRPQLTAAEIARWTEIPLGELKELLNQMVREARLTQQMSDGEPIFDVSLGRPAQRKQDGPASNLLDSLFG